jgi:hypothetical protein
MLFETYKLYLLEQVENRIITKTTIFTPELNDVTNYKKKKNQKIKSTFYKINALFKKKTS